MGTRSLTTVFDEQNKPLLSFYRQYDGYFEGHGAELQEFLKEMVVVNGYGSGTPAKAANRMSCLAAQLIKHFKDGIGGIYIVGHTDKREYNYEIRFVGKSGIGDNRVSLTGSNYCETKEFPLYNDEIIGAKVLRRVQFCYDKRDGEGAKWREVNVTDEDGSYIYGFENDKFKKFSISRIVGGKVLPLE
jgi:hypothetical protein